MGFVKVATIDQISEGEMMNVKVGKQDFVLVNYQGEIYALQGYCTHEQGLLWEGKLEDKTLTCPWHAAKFDITTGKVSERTRWATDLKKFEVKIEGKDIFINI